MSAAIQRRVLVWINPDCRDGSRWEYIFSQPLFGPELESVGQELVKQIRETCDKLVCSVRDDYSFTLEQLEAGELPWRDLESVIRPLIETVIHDQLHLSASLPVPLPK